MSVPPKPDVSYQHPPLPLTPPGFSELPPADGKPHPPPPPGYAELTVAYGPQTAIIQPPGYGQPQAIITQPPGYGQPQPIITQPAPYGQPAPQYMAAPEPPPNCPPGLEYLALLDQVLVHQLIELLEVLSQYETNNKYEIKNSLGQRMYFAAEDTDCCTRVCCGPGRPFDMKIFDNYQNEVIHLYRPYACSFCCCPCCLQNIEVSAPPGNVIGSVQQEWSFCYPTFAVKDASGETMMRIEGPCCGSGCCTDVNFRLTSADGSQDLGKITKQWGGFVRESATDADNFGITFPMNLDVRMKAVLLGACFLIDFMFFERAHKKH